MTTVSLGNIHRYTVTIFFLVMRTFNSYQMEILALKITEIKAQWVGSTTK